MNVIRPFPAVLPTAWMALGLVCGVSITGCNSGQAHPAADDARVPPQVPPIHLRQVNVTLHHGRPADQDNYTDMVANCRKANMPTRALSADQIKLIGRRFFDQWYEGSDVALQVDEWKFTAPTLCQFKLEHTSHRYLYLGNGDSYDIDLVAGTGSRQSGGKAWNADAWRPTAEQRAADDWLTAHILQELRAEGYDVQLLGQANAFGQPCERMRFKGWEVCTWIGGERWGFGKVGRDAGGGEGPIDGINFWDKPIDGEGPQLTTEFMTIGKPFGPDVFAPPPNVKITPEAP